MGKKGLLFINCIAAVALLGACGNKTENNKTAYEHNRSNNNYGYELDKVNYMSNTATDRNRYNNDVRAIYDDFNYNYNGNGYRTGNHYGTRYNNSNFHDYTYNKAQYGTYQTPTSVSYYHGAGTQAAPNYMASPQLVNKMSADEAKLAEEIKVKVEGISDVQHALTFVTDKDVYIAIKSQNGLEDNLRTKVTDAVKGYVDNRELHIGIGKSFLKDMGKILTDLNDGQPVQYEKTHLTR